LNFASLPLAALLSTLSLEHCIYIDLRQILQGLSLLKYQDQARLNQLFDAVLNVSYLHPNEVIKLLGFYARFASNATSLNPELFERLIDRLRLTYAQCNAGRQRDLDHVLTQLPGVQKVALEMKLGLQGPVATPTPTLVRSATIHPSVSDWSKAYQNQLFKAIADKDIATLNRLLGIVNFSPKTHQTPRGTKKTSFFTEPRTPRAVQQVPEVVFDNKQTANVMVTNFLQKTQAWALERLISKSSHDYFERLLYACTKHMQYQFAIGHDLNPVILYLPLGELQRMVDALIRLGFYQDHRATLALVEALFLRKQVQQDDVEVLTQLQYALLDRSIQFHAQYHRIATQRLKQQRLVVETRAEQLLDEDEGAEEQAISSPVVEQRRIEPTTRKTTTAGFREESLVLANGEPNGDAYYTSEHVHHLLAKKLQSRDDCHLLAPLDYHQAPSESNLENYLLEFLGNNQTEDKSHLIVPICIHQHWVAVKIFVEQSKISIAYYDSLKGSACKHLVMEATKKAVQAIYRPSAWVVEDKTCYFQDDGTSCGAYLVENIAKDVLGHIPKRLVTPTLRARHIDILGLNPQAPLLGRRTREEEEEPVDNRQKRRLGFKF
ncbi:MAG: Ulp1 family isopeptidase, partial [Legionellaceae bacterium]